MKEKSLLCMLPTENRIVSQKENLFFTNLSYSYKTVMMPQSLCETGINKPEAGYSVSFVLLPLTACQLLLHKPLSVFIISVLNVKNICPLNMKNLPLLSTCRKVSLTVTLGASGCTLRCLYFPGKDVSLYGIYTD